MLKKTGFGRGRTTLKQLYSFGTASLVVALLTACTPADDQSLDGSRVATPVPAKESETVSNDSRKQVWQPDENSILVHDDEKHTASVFDRTNDTFPVSLAPVSEDVDDLTGFAPDWGWAVAESGDSARAVTVYPILTRLEDNSASPRDIPLDEIVGSPDIRVVSVAASPTEQDIFFAHVDGLDMVFEEGGTTRQDCGPQHIVRINVSTRDSEIVDHLDSWERENPSDAAAQTDCFVRSHMTPEGMKLKGEDSEQGNKSDELEALQAMYGLVRDDYYSAELYRATDGVRYTTTGGDFYKRTKDGGTQSFSMELPDSIDARDVNLFPYLGYQ